MSGRCQSEPIAINQNILQQPATSKKRRLWSEVPGRMVQQPTVAASSQYLFIGSYYSNRWWSNYKLAKSTSDLRNISDTKTLPPAACLVESRPRLRQELWWTTRLDFDFWVQITNKGRFSRNYVQCHILWQNILCLGAAVLVLRHVLGTI